MRAESQADYDATIEDAYRGLDIMEEEIKQRNTAFFLGDER